MSIIIELIMQLVRVEYAVSRQLW